MLFVKTGVISTVLCMYKCDIFFSVMFRGISSLCCALLFALSIGYYVIVYLKKLHIYQVIRLDGPKKHLLKHDVPTMGGIIILISVIISIIVWSNLLNLYVWYVLFIFLSYGILGIVDDMLKVKRKSTVGLGALNKYCWQSFVSVMFIIVFFINNTINDMEIQLIGLEYVKDIIFKLDIWGMLLAYFMIVGTSNSVNLSDGLDGLAIGLIVLVVFGLAVIACVTSNAYIADCLHIPYDSDAKELVIICAIIIGSSLGFLWFNAYPAQIFMGDTGSLALGGAIGVISILLCQPYLLLIMGGVFVIESLSVILQVSYFKVLKKRIFKMAPIHHHFELKGYLESKIVVRFWIISSILVLLGLATLILNQYFV